MSRCTALLTMLLMLAPAHAEQRGAVTHDALQSDVSLIIPAHARARVQLYEPIPGAPLSSCFCWRVNPVLERVRFHAGVDFAAPVGTRVQASGAGRIVRIERAPDRGLYVFIRHAGQVQTAYSHLSSIARGLHVGQRVKAHQFIGKVGMSGRSSGPHLDFEVYVDGRRVDPGAMLADLRVARAEQAQDSRGIEFAAAELVPVGAKLARPDGGVAGDI